MSRTPLIILSLAGFYYLFPRFLIEALGKENPWTSYLYMYGLGFSAFGLGMMLILKTGALVPGRGHDSLWLKVLIGGFAFFASLHGLWVFFALNMPYKGI